MSGADPQGIARELIAGFSANDMPRMRAVLADDLHAYITNREGGVDEVVGADGYLARVEAMDLPSASFRVDVTGFPSTTSITLSHIHTGDANTAGGVLVSANVNPGEVVLVNGAVTYSRLSITTTPAIAQSIINNPAGFYFNVHTAANPSGVMRGQLVKQ